ncbi:hypothetical protein [Catalinimonas niigatensis]|uniref:hypothetical protein n=1 Tax=Catalinimonas niigatensis TaxID=1397264 RepID=UPI0026655DAE|nr:hypothetical protein [Catalinimonas niigatensis]WPP49231.1 hypothetical protein PZB72_21415 [Catalinimonas niigatensis]
MNASVHKGNGEVIENAALAFQDEKITLLADARLIRLDMTAFEVVEAYGLHIYPASLLEKSPAIISEKDSLYYVTLNSRDAGLLTSAKFPAAQSLPVLEEGAEATFVVSKQVLDEEGVDIRYLVVKGKLKQENNLSLRLLRPDQ